VRGGQVTKAVTHATPLLLSLAWTGVVGYAIPPSLCDQPAKTDRQEDKRG